MALSSAAGLGHLESYSGVAHATLARNVNVVRPQFALFDPDHLALVPHLLRSLDLLHTHTMPLSLHSRTLISPTHVAARLAGCARARTHLAQPRASPTLLAGHAVVEGVPARRRADQSRTSHSTQCGGPPSSGDVLRAAPRRVGRRRPSCSSTTGRCGGCRWRGVNHRVRLRGVERAAAGDVGLGEPRLAALGLFSSAPPESVQRRRGLRPHLSYMCAASRICSSSKNI